MRLALFSALLLPCAACASEAAPERTEGRDSGAVQVSPAAQSFPVLLLPDGLQTTGDATEAWRFGADASAVQAGLANALGQPRTEFLSPDCETGPLLIVTYPGNIDVSFADGSFAGWVVQGHKEPLVATPEGVTTGTKLVDLAEKIDVSREGITPLGAQYSSEAGYSFSTLDQGDGQEVTAIDAGVVCFKG